ncbi:metallopeptidase [Metallosphaera tengchongensis]|uniref:Metallopeptidase n=1 Tax=Metallosphaera tengchongensis TaxID=1532350 RepID=A0A6N0NY60_9CREN|nr:putative metallopeptidase [Metallosphaera tengchongensis]QKR00061.1 metallopeptidase [Metallosphaera tengchongensis]
MKFELAPDVKKTAETVNLKLDLGLDLERVEFIRSFGSRSRAYARTLALPSQWRYILDSRKIYIVEVISEKFDRLTCEDRVYIVVHELMHIPNGMRGGLRNHSYAGFRRIRHLTRKVLSEQELC